MVKPTSVFDDELINKILVDTGEEKNKGFKEYLEYLKGFLTHNVGHSYLYIWAYRIRTERLAKDYDHVTVITGKEGTGKSTLAGKLAILVDPDLSMDRVCYKPEEFVSAAANARPGQSIWIDEGGLFFFSRDSMSTVSKELTQFLTTCRQLNLHIILCIPNFFILETYIREHRVHSLFHVVERGSFKYFREDAIFKVALWGKQGKNVMSPKILLGKNEWRWGSFNSYLPDSLGGFTKDLYVENKGLAMQEQLKTLRQKLNDIKTDEGLINDDSMGYVDTTTFCKLTGVNPNTVRNKIKAGKLKYMKIGAKYLVSREELKPIGGRQV